MPGEALLNWYEAVRRPLPWRFTRDPWAILVSEVMLQQTQAARVVPHYERFLARFPTPAACAEAPGGRGHRGVERARLQPPRAGAAGGRGHGRGGRAGRRDLQALPGVGPYTAAAVASFAWDAQVAAVDTNVRRVIERRDGVRRSPRALARRAAELLPEGRAAAWNQAMMELGATICRPRRPRCGECPLQAGLRRPRRAPAAGAPARRALRGLRPLGARAAAGRARGGGGAAGAGGGAAGAGARRARARRADRARGTGRPGCHEAEPDRGLGGR